jgi:parallel beta-helix repeat protein
MITTALLLFCFSSLFSQDGSCEQYEGSQIYVNSLGNGNFSTIQAGIDAASKGDIIFVNNGTYYENIVIDKSIKLIGNNKHNTVIDGRGAGNVLKINAENAIIKNFTIRNSGTIFPNAGINLSSNYNTIEENIIINNLYGMTLYESSYNKIKENLIQENENCGIYLSNSSHNLILYNMIHNQFYNGIGIYDSSDNNTIKNNTLTNNGFCGINIRISSHTTIISNNISNNNIGIHIPASKNIIDNNYFSNNNVNIDKELITPGFELILFFISLLLIMKYYIKKKEE